MNAYVIGYDLNRPGQDYSSLFEAIKAHIDANDELLVIEHRGAAAWSGFDDTGSKWLKNNL